MMLRALRSKLTLYYRCNQMVLANVLANLGGIWIVTIISSRSFHPVPQHIQGISSDLDYLFRIAVFVALIAIPLIYERPIRNYFAFRGSGFQPRWDDIAVPPWQCSRGRKQSTALGEDIENGASARQRKKSPG
jgi:hypothetical protein